MWHEFTERGGSISIHLVSLASSTVSLFLFDNTLVGTVPSELGRLSNLGSLRVSPGEAILPVQYSDLIGSFLVSNSLRNSRSRS